MSPPDSWGEQYLRLLLRSDRQVPGNVDARVGPPALRQAVPEEESRPPAALRQEVADLQAELPHQGYEESRRALPKKQLRAIETLVRKLAGETLTYGRAPVFGETHGVSRFPGGRAMGRVTKVCLAGVLLCAGLALMAACQAHTYNVRYEISGTASTIRATYTNASGATEQRDVQGSWSLDLQASAGKFLTLRAVNPTAEGTVRCRLLIDGKVFKEGESTGGFKFVDCSGIIPLPTPAPTAPRP